MKSILRPRQLDAIRGVAAARRRGATRIVLASPTGSGKSVIAAALAESVMHDGLRVAITVPRVDLIDQFLALLDREGLGHEVGVVQGDHPRTRPSALIQVCSVQTLARRGVPNVAAALVDEAHLQFASLNRWMASPEVRRIPIIGLSATPWARGMAHHWQTLIVAATTRELIAEGALVPMRVFAPTRPDLSAVKIRAGDFAEDQLAATMNTAALVGDVVETWLTRGEDRPTLVFAVDRAHGRHLAERFAAAAVSVRYVDGEVAREERTAVRAAFEAGEIRVIVSVQTMTTGTDLPSASCIVLARPTRSEMLFVQVAGRGLRTAPEKQDCLLLDHSGTSLALGLPHLIHHDELDDGAPKARSANASSTVVACSECSAVMSRATQICPACGYDRVPRIECAPGRLDEVRAVHGPSREVMTEWLSGLTWIAERRGYKPGWPRVQFRERFGMWPPVGLNPNPSPPTTAVADFVREKLAQWRASRAA